MSPIMKIAKRRLNADIRKNIYLVLAIFLSMTIISAFVFFQLQTATVKNPAYAALPFREFIGKLSRAMSITLVFLLAITLISLRIHFVTRGEENKHTLSVLTSIGATASQRRKLILAEIMLLYLPPTLLGTVAGALPGLEIGNSFIGVTSAPRLPLYQYLITGVLLFAAVLILIILSCLAPSFETNRRSLIQSIRRSNTKAQEERHGYRSSGAYLSEAPLKRLAKKGRDYHSRTYNRVSLALAAAALYPALSVLLFMSIADIEIVLDSNPYDGIDTSQAVLAVMDRLLAFLGIGFLVLSALGILQAILISRIQIASRRSSTRVYLSVGLSSEDVNKMLHFELKSVALRILIILIFSVFIIRACYSLI